MTDQEISLITSSINQNSTTGVRNHAIVVTALDNGLRASELADIELGQLDLKSGYVKVMGKGAKERIVPIGEEAIQKPDLFNSLESPLSLWLPTGQMITLAFSFRRVGKRLRFFS
ncbi:tyrosine-type recombinase/integrase [Chloroflexota bacterium]